MQELAKGYEDAANKLRISIAAMTARLETETDEREKWTLKHKIDRCLPVMYECERMAEYCRRYYEKGYYIGDGPFGSKRNIPGKKKVTYADTHNYDGDRVDL